MLVICKDTNEIITSYGQYLSSEHWKNFKKSYKKEHPKKCYICSKKKTVQLHHMSYKNLGNEQFDEVVWLCRKHHHQLHKALGK